MKKVMDTTVKLNNGLEMPIFGYGSYLVTDPAKAIPAITHALNYGYKMIDTADIYHNHDLVRQAIANSNVERKDIWITTKIWIEDKNHDTVIADFERILKELDTDYIDLLLVHWPLPSGIEIYKAMEEIYATGKVKSIGVSNFMVDQLEELLAKTSIIPAVNQVEWHPQLLLPELIKYCEEHQIVLESWQTIMKGQVGEIKLLADLATKYGVDAPAVALRWGFQHGVIIIPKSETLSRIESNASMLDEFELTKEEMKSIDELGSGNRLSVDPHKYVGNK